MKNPVDDLVAELKTGGILAIEEIVARKEQEQFFVDFKRTSASDYSNKRCLEASDCNNFARAISGFGNSEGGVLIWGIDGKDFASEKMPIKGFEKFLSLLNSYVSKCTIPAHELVENFAIPDGDAGGFVVSIIPKSQRTPHRTIEGGGEGKYLMRAGESFLSVPHSVLAGMFGRRPSPEILLVRYNANLKHRITDGFAIVEFSVVLGNSGLGIGRDIYLNAEVVSRPSQVGFHTTYVRSSFEGRSGLERGVNLYFPELVLAPEQTIEPIEFRIRIAPPFDRDFAISFVCGSEGQPPYRWDLKWDSDRLERFYQAASGHPELEGLIGDMLF